MTEQPQLPCNTCVYGKPLYVNKYGEVSGGCWRFFICFNPKYIKLESIIFTCKDYVSRSDKH